MSTKSTLAYGSEFHLYHELFDCDHVNLELQTTHFEAGYGRVMVEIPIHIWEVIRRRGGADLALADKSDADLRQFVEHDVDERIRAYQEVERRRHQQEIKARITDLERSSDPFQRMK